MNRLAVQSREIAIIGYDDKTSKLEIAFRRGGVYRYLDVPEDIYKAFLSAESHGSYFQDKIKDKFDFVKVS